MGSTLYCFQGIFICCQPSAVVWLILSGRVEGFLHVLSVFCHGAVIYSWAGQRSQDTLNSVLLKVLSVSVFWFIWSILWFSTSLLLQCSLITLLRLFVCHILLVHLCRSQSQFGSSPRSRPCKVKGGQITAALLADVFHNMSDTS